MVVTHRVEGGIVYHGILGRSVEDKNRVSDMTKTMKQMASRMKLLPRSRQGMYCDMSQRLMPILLLLRLHQSPVTHILHCTYCIMFYCKSCVRASLCAFVLRRLLRSPHTTPGGTGWKASDLNGLCAFNWSCTYSGCRFGFGHCQRIRL